MSNEDEMRIEEIYDELPAWVAAIAAGLALLAYATWLSWVRDRAQKSSRMRF